MSAALHLAHGPVSETVWLVLPVSLATAAAGVGAWWYLRGLAVVRRHPQGRRTQRWRPWAAVAGVVTTVTICSPWVGEPLEQRLSTHMVQHVVLITVAAPLLALSAPGQPMLAGMPARLRRPLVRIGHRMPTAVLLTPYFAWTAHVAALWMWHLPAAYDEAVRSEPVHLAEHAAFLLTGWLFWWHVATLSRHRLRGIPAMLYVVAAIPPGAALGAVLTFPRHPLYPLQAARASASGISPVRSGVWFSSSVAP